MKKKKISIFTFYRFKSLTNLRKTKEYFNKSAKSKKILGTILLANEGINGTISGDEISLYDFIKEIKKTLRIRKLPLKISNNSFIPFYRMKVRIKKEIVTIGRKSIQPEKKTGKHIAPNEWDKIMSDSSYIVLDTRNKYEIDIGTFKNSVNPDLDSFRDFPKFVDKNLKKNQKIAMFCTGGIRCEKASSYLLNKGFKNVFQLEGGILNYFEQKKKKNRSSWRGECFVFDNRVAVNTRLKKGKYDQCYGCRHPITMSDKKLKSYIKGTSCKYCIGKRNIKQIQASTTRQKQIEIAEQNNKNHNFKKIYEKDLL